MYYHQLKRIGLLLVVFLLLPIAVQAESEARVDPNIEEQGGIELDSQRFPYDHYEPITDTTGDWNPFTLESVDKGLNAIASLLFSITKLLANLIDVSLANLYSVNIIESLSNTIDNVSSSLWENLKDNFGAVLFVLAAIQIFAYYVGQRNSSKAGSAALKLMAVIILAFVWFSNSSFFLNTLNKVSNEVQGIVMASGTFLADEEVEEGNKLEGSQALMRNRSFDLLVYKPYLQMNYGTTNEEAVLENDGEGTHRINDLLTLKKNEEGLKERETIAKNEVEDLQNMDMSSSNIPGKVGVAIFSIVLALMLGLPLVIISMVNILLQILALIIAVVLPISFIVSFLPAFSNSGLYTLGKLVGVFLMKVFVGLLLLFTFLLIEITQTIISTENVGLYILNVLVTSVLLILMLMKRDKIIEFITAGRVTAVNYGISKAANKTTEKVKEKTQNTARKTASMTGRTAKKSAAMVSGGVGVTAAATAKGAQAVGRNAKQKLNDRNALRNEQKLREDQIEKGNLVDINDFKDQKRDNSKSVQSSVPNQNRENIQRTEQDSPTTGNKKEQGEEGKQPKNVRVNNVQPIERKNRNNQSLNEKENQHSRLDNNSQRSTNEQLRQNANNKNLNQQRKQSRSIQHNNPNNTPITQWEANKEVAAHKEVRKKERNTPKKNDVKKRAKNINRIRNRNDKSVRNERKKRNNNS
ncbi:CD3337/EF1877 family mobilome membrane protein [Virgibacillus salexigens]|uniref:CD3337/EF1877 family mobilome membrane protein n=1 Tax=Virgibacillus salexigens TaxID=61016 RepID=UPI003081345A